MEETGKILTYFDSFCLVNPFITKYLDSGMSPKQKLQLIIARISMCTRWCNVHQISKLEKSAVVPNLATCCQIGDFWPLLALSFFIGDWQFLGDFLASFKNGGFSGQKVLNCQYFIILLTIFYRGFVLLLRQGGNFLATFDSKVAIFWWLLILRCWQCFWWLLIENWQFLEKQNWQH